jgi:uncharacterized repeat protein (TIGR01451 family)
MVLTKNDLVDPVKAGDVLTYTIDILNMGPTSAQGIVISDTMPLKVSLLDVMSATPASCDSSEHHFLCFMETRLNADEQTVITAVVRVDSEATGTLVNVAGVTAAGNDPLLSNNTQAEVTTIGDVSQLKEADVGVWVKDTPDPIIAGGLLTYTLTISNTGPSEASGVVVKSSLPVSTTFVKAAGAMATCNQAQSNLICTLNNDLAAGEATTIAVQVQVDPQATGTLQNITEVSAAGTDPNQANNTRVTITSLTDVYDPQAQVDLALSVVDTPDPVDPGAALQYEMTITNGGPTRASGIVLVNTLPADVTFVRGTVDQGWCGRSDSAIICSLSAPLAQGASTTVLIETTVTETAAGTLTNVAEVTSGGADTQMANNTATTSTTVGGIQPVYLPLIER